MQRIIGKLEVTYGVCVSVRVMQIVWIAKGPGADGSGECNCMHEKIKGKKQIIIINNSTKMKNPTNLQKPVYFN